MKSRHLIFVSILLIATTAMGTNAQSQDRDNPTPLTSNTIRGDGVGKKVQYFYSFTAGPGEITVAVDLKANAGATNADIEIFDAESNKIFYLFPNATGQGEHAVKKFSLSSKQNVVLRIALDASAGGYTIKLTGPVEFVQGETPADASTPPASAEPQPTQPDVPANTAGETSTKKTKSSNLDFGVNLLQTVGSHFGLPTSGILHLVMKDGSLQDIDLSRVKSASINK